MPVNCKRKIYFKDWNIYIYIYKLEKEILNFYLTKNKI